MLWLIARYSAAGAGGHMLEFSGSAVRGLPVEARLTLCNLAVEFSAFSGIVAPDDTVFEYLAGRPYAPAGAQWDEALAHWRSLYSDDDAVFDRSLSVDCGRLAPMVTWGTSPQHGVAVDGTVPDPASAADADARQAMERALAYMDLRPGQAMAGIAIDAAFLGSCTNSRLSDLRSAASVLAGRKVATGVRAICVPGSSAVRRAAEAEGLDRVFRAAGFEWPSGANRAARCASTPAAKASATGSA